MDFIKSLSSVCQKVFAFLQSRKHKIQIHGEHYREHEIEALKVNVNEVFIHLNHLLEQTKFSSGYGDFIFSRIFPFWIMHERTEYFYELSIWGLR
ncbi:YxiF family protein [Bacillus safensis]